VIAVVAASTGIVTTVLTYLLSKRRSSGSVETSEASELWRESAALRDQLRTEAATLRAEVESMRAEAAAMRTEMAALRAETAQLREEAATLREEAALLRTSEARCREEQMKANDELRKYRGLLVQAGLLEDRHP
jgi:uncharacterized coiled-coil DUF342 family protein